MDYAITIYESGQVKVFKVDSFLAHQEVAGDVISWCSYNRESAFNFYKCHNNVYMLLDESKDFPNRKIAILVSCAKDIHSIDQNGNEIDISSYNLPEDLFEAKIESHEEKIINDPFYIRLQNRE